MSVGLGGKIDGADQGDKAKGGDSKRWGEENACKAFSKDLIVRAIPRHDSLFQTPKEFPLKEACFPASRWGGKAPFRGLGGLLESFGGS